MNTRQKKRMHTTQKKTDMKMQRKLKSGQYYASKYRKLST